jgi:hypothetical protein
VFHYPNHQSEETSNFPESWTQLISSINNVVEVVWIDALTHGGPGWVDTDEVLELLKKKEGRNPEMRTVGHLISKENDCIIVTDTLGPEESGSVHVIPMGMVKEIRILKYIEGS